MTNETYTVGKFTVLESTIYVLTDSAKNRLGQFESFEMARTFSESIKTQPASI